MFTKTAVFIFSFVGIFAVLFTGINNEFYSYQADYAASVGLAKDVASRFELANVTIYSQSGNASMTWDYSSYDDEADHEWSMGLPDGQFFEVWWSWFYYPVKALEFRHTTEVLWGLAHVSMDIYDADGDLIGKHIAEEDNPIGDYYDPDVNASVFQTKSPVPASVLVGYNQSKYNNITHAWNSGELSYILSYEFDQNASKMSIWGLMGALLTFNSPALGLTGFAGTLINALIAVPLMVITVILILKLVFAIIPFIKGVDE